MNQQPDKFFREKLEGYHKAAPASAWEKIAAAQVKKNNKGLWLKIAASLLFLVVAASLLWTRFTTDHKQSAPLTIVREKKSPAPEVKEEQTTGKTDDGDRSAESQSSPVDSPKLSSVKKTNVKTGANRNVKPTVPPNAVNQKVSEEVHPAEEVTEQQDIVLPLSESIETSVASQPTAVNEEEQKSITLVFTAKEADEYLNKKALAQATSDEKKPSTLKKLLKKANDLSNQDPFGELRQKKMKFWR